MRWQPCRSKQQKEQDYWLSKSAWNSQTARIKCWSLLQYNLERRNHCYVELCDLNFGEDSYVVWQLSTWDSHISRYKYTYIDSQLNNEKISCKVAYAILLHIHIFLQSCINAHDPGDDFFSTFKILQDSIMFRTLSITLPMSFRQSLNPAFKRKNNNDNNEGSKRIKQEGSTVHDSSNPFLILHQPIPHPSVLKISGESFCDYYKHLEDYDDDTMKHGACLKWQFEMPSQLHSWPLDPWPCDKCPAVCW